MNLASQRPTERGMTLIEVMISSGLMLLIMTAIYMMIMVSQSIHLTETRKLDTNQASRALEQLLSDHLRSAGAVITLYSTPFYGVTAPVFNGVYPLNNNDYPDGIILAAGDMHGATRLTQAGGFAPGGTSMNVTPHTDNSAALWQAGDTGMICNNNGYYVFHVISTSPATIISSTTGSVTLTLSATPVYYSRLLQSTHYKDNCLAGNSVYPDNSPVIRLTNFAVFLAREEADLSRSYCMISDFGGNAGTDAFIKQDATFDAVNHRSIGATPIAPNIEDVQFEYIESDGTVINNPADNSLFLTPSATAIATFLSVRVSILAKTEEEKEKSKNVGMIYAKPAMGDRAATKLPLGRYHYQFTRYEISLRNFNTLF